MGTAAYSERQIARQMEMTQRRSLALNALSNDLPITKISERHKVSRKFVYAQKDKAVAAIDDAFSDSAQDEKVLFYIPVTKTWLCTLILALVLNCRGTFRGVAKTFLDVLDFKISIGTVHNVVKEATNKARDLNKRQDLKGIKLVAPDELFHHNKPVLAGVDIPSLYCYLLSHEQQRDSDTWAIHLLDLEKQGFSPERIIADDGAGLRSGHKTVFPNVPCHIDNFHITKTLQELRLFFRNRKKSATTYLKEMEDKMSKAIKNKNAQKYSHKLGLARKHLLNMECLSQSITTLVGWMEHDVLNKAGPEPHVRRELFDFIVDEFEKLEKLHKHRIRAVRLTLKTQRELLLAFTDLLNEKFEAIASQFFCSTEIIWRICELQRYKHGGDNYAIRSVPFQLLYKEQFYQMEDAVIASMNKTERTSSMIENLNSRLRPYFFLRREIGHDYLELLRFYLNHSVFLRSSNPGRVGKSPTEILTEKKHSHWLEMLDLKRFKRKH